MMARALRDGSYVVSCFHMAKRTCESLRASATMATWLPRLAATCLAHRTIGSCGRCRYSDHAACPNAQRTCGEPACVNRVRFVRNPVVCSPGMRPKYDATLDAFGKRSTSSSAATNRADVTGPTPG